MDRDEKFEHLFDDDDEFKTEPGDFHFDEDIKLDEPAEYQFSDDIEPVDVMETEPVAEESPGLFEKLSQLDLKKILIYLAGAVLVIAFMGAMLKTWLNSRQESHPAPATATINQAETQALVPVKTEVKPKGQLEVDVNLAKQLKALSKQNVALADRVQVLESQVAQTAAQLSTYQQQAAKSQADADGLTKTVARVEQQMMQINNALQTLVTAAKPTNMPQIRPATQSLGSTLPPARSYYVQAIIPGRAWLKANNGQIITVGLGDSIPGFGQVTLIDPQNGMVRTNAGMAINYAIDEG